jgi:tRNA pseudouridine55 synthase
LTEGIILLDKPPGQTSFQSLGLLKRALATGRVGHAGTLDRFAEGLLVVLAGRMTRLAPLATSLDKEYLATFTFGTGTDTLDPEGAVTAEGRIPGASEIEAALPGFTGALSQVPPAYSAVHVGGVRASEAARKGRSVRLDPRPVVVHRFEMLDYRAPEVRVRIGCSKGTYVRSLARDLASALGTCAYVSKLRRTRIGGFSVEDACRPGDFLPQRDLLPPAAFFDAAPDLGRVLVRDECRGAVATGARLTDSMFLQPCGSAEILGAFDRDGQLLAVLGRSGRELRYLAAFPPAAPVGPPR